VRRADEFARAHARSYDFDSNSKLKRQNPEQFENE
jgi:hypothetical protein